MTSSRSGAYSIESVHLALLFARKAESKPKTLFTLDTLRRLVAVSDRESK